MKKILNGYFRFLQYTLTAMIVLLIIPVFLQVISRFVSVIPRYIWTEEIARFAFIWIILIGAAVAVRDQSHFKVDLLPTLSPQIESALRIVLLMLMLLLAGVLLVGGLGFAGLGLTQISAIAGLPMWAIYVAWPFAGLSMILFLVEQIYDHFHTQTNTPHGTP